MCSWASLKQARVYILFTSFQRWPYKFQQLEGLGEVLCYLSELFHGSHYRNTAASKDGKNSGLAILEIAGVQTLPLRIVWPVGDTHESLKFSNSLIYSIVEIYSPNAITKPSFMLFVLVATIIDPWPNLSVPKPVHTIKQALPFLLCRGDMAVDCVHERKKNSSYHN